VLRARIGMQCLLACASCLALTLLSPHLHQDLAALGIGRGGIAAKLAGQAEMYDTGCCPPWQYYFNCPKCGTPVLVPDEDKGRDGFVRHCDHCSAPTTKGKGGTWGSFSSPTQVSR
jgi:hypothetical protein